MMSPIGWIQEEGTMSKSSGDTTRHLSDRPATGKRHTPDTTIVWFCAVLIAALAILTLVDYATAGMS